MSVLKRVAVIVAVLGLWGLIGLSDAALAQDGTGEGEGDSGGGAPPTEVVTPVAPVDQRASQIGVTIARIGVGGRARPGEWAAVQVVLTNQTDKLRDVLVRAVIPDPDGDRTAYERTILSNPGATQSMWLYIELPFRFDGGTPLTVTVYEAEESGGSGAARFRAGRELGSASNRLTNIIQPTVGMIGVVGDRAGALDQYSVRPPNMPNLDYAPTGHELTDLVPLQIAELPDRVMGLLSFDTIVWTGAGQGRDPTEMSLDQAATLREWVRRGGHLVVVLPNAGQAWLRRGDNPLADIMPSATPVLYEGVNLNPMRRLLTDQSVPLPDDFSVQAFRVEPGTGPYEAMPVLNVPGDFPSPGLAGQPVVIRRLVAQGAVTVVGIDIARPRLVNIRGVEADVFWNRVLGRRIDLRKPDDLASLQNSGALYLGNRRDKVLDGAIGGEIAKTAEAAAGLLLAFVVFGLYWLLAGPVGHFVLRRRDLRRHSWVTFVGIAGVFTALAWGGANLIKAKRVSGNHLTFIDHVYGQSSQRTRTWVNVHVPRYGFVKVSASDDDADTASDWHASVAPWDDPEAGSSGWGGFPDSREYSVESRSPGSITVPFRSTAKQFRIDWAGPVRDKWGMPKPVQPAPGPDGAVTPLGREIRIIPSTEGRSWEISGQLTHDLPKELVNVQIVVIPHQGALDTAPDKALVRNAMAVTLQKWSPGETIDLGAMFGPAKPAPGSGAKASMASEWLQRLLGVPSGHLDGLQDRSTGRVAEDSELTALSFFSMLEPPVVRENQTQLESTYVARRRATHGLDLGRWFTQPCVIVVGQIVDEDSPTPLKVDGRDVELRGKTVVRWVYPLSPDPPEYGSRLTETPAATGPEASPAESAPGQQPPKPRGPRR